MLKLRPVEPDIQDEEKLKKQIIALLEQEFYVPLLKILDVKKKKIQNSVEDLISAIKTGKIYYSRGRFRGKFDSTLTRELRNLGADWDRRHDGWAIPLSKLPVFVRVEIGVATARVEEKSKKLIDSLYRVDPAKIAEKLAAENTFDASLTKAQKKIEKSLSLIGIAPTLTEAQKMQIVAEYTANTQKDIKGWLDEEVVALRTQVQKLVMQGVRYETMIDAIQKSYKVSREKATFWARQENNLMVAKLRESEFRDAGVMKYEWHTVVGSPLHPVRDSHKVLDRKIFSWDDPPITSDPGKPVRRNHPGEDYNCRCIAVPFID